MAISPAVQRQLDARHLTIWLPAVDLQADRAANASVSQVESIIDFHLFAVALRQLLRAVRFCRVYEPSAVDLALNAFDAAIPNAVEIRDILEHFDDYERGKGNLQQGDKPEVPVEMSEWYENDGTTAVLHLGPFLLDVRQAQRAAGQLARAVAEAV